MMRASWIALGGALVAWGQEGGRIEPVAGAVPGQREQAAVQAPLLEPTRVLSAGPDGFYFSEPGAGIYKVDAEGTLRLFAPVTVPGALADTDAMGGYWYATGTGIRRVSPEGTDSSFLNFLNDGTSALLSLPAALACRPAGALCVLANSQGVFSLPGPNRMDAFLPARGARRLSLKSGLLAIDANGLRVYGPGEGQVLAGSGQIGIPAEGQPAAEAPFFSLVDVVEDGDRRIFAAAAGNAAVYRLDRGAVELVAGSRDGPPAEPGMAAREAKFRSVNSIAVDGKGRLLIADPDAFTIWAVDGEGSLSRAAGRPRTIGATALESELSDPNGVAFDSDGNLYIADRLGFRIHMVAADGAWETVAGNGRAESTGDGGLAVEASIQPTGSIAVNGEGTVFFIDSQVAIRRFRRGGPIETWLTREEAFGTGTAAGFFRIAANPRGGLVLSTIDRLFRISEDKQVQEWRINSLLPNAVRFAQFALLDDGSVVVPQSGFPLFARVTPSGEVINSGRPEGAPCMAAPEPVLAGAGQEILAATATAICRIALDGSFRLIGGGPPGPSIPDGAPALSGALSGVTAMAAGPSGTVAFTERATRRVRRVVP